MQTKRCKTKQGIVKTLKKTYCDLMYDKNDTDVVDWFENLEEKTWAGEAWREPEGVRV